MFYDMHTHTNHSHDSKQDPEESCLTAIKKGLRGIAITDHADMWYFNERNSWEHITNSVTDAERLNEKYKEQLRVFRGYEVADAYFDRGVTDKLINDLPCDVVIGSIHCLSYAGLSDAYSCMDFSDNVISYEKTVGVVKRYFDLLIDMAENYDYDILAHLTCPFRYINGKYGRGLRSEDFESEIKTVLRAVISRKKALEINTSGIGTPLNATMPDTPVLLWYREMGGELISLGSDAHSAERLGNGFEDVSRRLRELGFTNYAYYENRSLRIAELPKL